MTLLVVTSALTSAATAAAATYSSSPMAILLDCEHHNYQITHPYSTAALRAAYDHISTTTAAYSPCATVIYNQLQTQLNHRHIGGSGSGSSGFPWIIVVIAGIVVIGVGGAGVAYYRNRQAGASEN